MSCTGLESVTKSVGSEFPDEADSSISEEAISILKEIDATGIDWSEMTGNDWSEKVKGNELNSVYNN